MGFYTSWHKCNAGQCGLIFGVVDQLLPDPSVGIKANSAGTILPFEIDFDDADLKAEITGTQSVDNKWLDDLIKGMTVAAVCDPAETGFFVFNSSCGFRKEVSCSATTGGTDKKTILTLTGLEFRCWFGCVDSGGFDIENPFDSAVVCTEDGRVRPAQNTTRPTAPLTNLLNYYLGDEDPGSHCFDVVFPESPLVLGVLDTGERVFLCTRDVADAATATGSLTGFRFAQALEAGVTTGTASLGECSNAFVHADDYDVLVDPTDSGSNETWLNGYGAFEVGDMLCGAVYSSGDILIVNVGCTKGT